MLYILLFALALGLQDFRGECDPGYLLVRCQMVTKDFAIEQAYQIIDPPRVLAVSTAFMDHAKEVYSHCVPENENKIYTVELIDKSGDGWGKGSHISIQGQYGQTVYHGTFDKIGVAKKVVQISFYTPITSSTVYKYYNASPPSGWYKASFNDETWSNMTPATTLKGTVYLRKTFAGRGGYAAYEVGLVYQEGVIFYVNDVEVHRDNMPSGEITHTTQAVGKYAKLNWKSIIRGGLEAQAETSVLAIELHFMDNTKINTHTIDSLLAMYLPSVGDSCYLSSEFVNLSSNGQTSNPNNFFNAMDEDVTTIWRESHPAFYLDFSFPDFRPLLNGLQVFVDYDRERVPSYFKIFGSMALDGEMDTLLEKAAYRYVNNDYEVFKISTNNVNYLRYRLDIAGTLQGSLFIRELMPLTCAFPVPTALNYGVESMTLYRHVTDVLLIPSYEGWSECSGDLPIGLDIDTNNCKIVGVVRGGTDGKYTITAKKPKTSSVTFDIKIRDCTGSVLEMNRQYPTSDAGYEAYKITNLETNEIVFQEKPYTTQVSGEVSMRKICLTPAQYELEMWSSIDDEWMVESYISLSYYSIHEPHSKLIMKRRYDPYSGWNPTARFYFELKVPYGAKWNYLSKYLPYGWNTGAEPSGADWTDGYVNNFPTAETQIQLYHQPLNMTELLSSTAIEIEVAFQFGIQIYIGSTKVYTLNVNEPVNNKTYATNSYLQRIHRRLHFPVSVLFPQLFTDDTEDPEVILSEFEYERSQGRVSEMVPLYIALFTRNEDPKTSTFEATVEFYREKSYGRNMGFEPAADDFPMYSHLAFDQASNTEWSSSTDCVVDGHWLQIKYNDDRKDWITKYFVVSSADLEGLPYSWEFQARNREMSPNTWDTLDVVSGVEWWEGFQRKDFYVVNKKLYNTYRLAKMKTKEWDEGKCQIDIVEFGVVSETLNRNIPPLVYYERITAYALAELPPVFPNSPYYSRFTVKPALTSGLKIDYTTGMISGSKLSLMEDTSYTFYAFPPSSSAEVNTTVIISIIKCEHSVIQSEFLTDMYPGEMQWSLREGHNGQGKVLFSKLGFNMKTAFERVTFCLPNNLYEVQLYDRLGDGWYYPSAWRIYELNTEFPYAIAHLGEDRYGQGSLGRERFKVNTQVPPEAKTLKLRRTEDVMNGWKEMTFDDSKWETVTGSMAGKYTTTTNYIRHTISVELDNDYVINVMVRFNGGIVGYINAQPFLLVGLTLDQISPLTKAKAGHEPSKWVSASIGTRIFCEKEGKQQLSFEIHQATDQSATTENNFDVFVQLSRDYANTYLYNTVASVSSSHEPLVGKPEYMYDGMLYEKVTYTVSDPVSVSCMFTNELGVRFNTIRFHSVGTSGLFTFEVYGMLPGSDKWNFITTEKDILIRDRNITEMTAYGGLLGFKGIQLKLINAKSPNTITLTEFALAYTGVPNRRCDTDGGFPTVAVNQYSAKPCAEYYDGFMSRRCGGFGWHEPNNSTCFPYPPLDLKYPSESYMVYTSVKLSPIVPSIWGIVKSYEVEPNLMNGLELNTKTGVISGMPTVPHETVKYTVTARNSMGLIHTTISFTAGVGMCPLDGLWLETEVGKVAKVSCGSMNKGVGTMSRYCVQGANTPEWQEPTGRCVSYLVLIIVGVLLLILLAALVVSGIQFKGRGRARKSGTTAATKKATRTDDKVSKKGLLAGDGLE